MALFRIMELYVYLQSSAHAVLLTDVSSFHDLKRVLPTSYCGGAMLLLNREVILSEP